MGRGEEGPLWGSESVFLLLEDASAKPSSCLHSGCSVLAWFFSPLLALLQECIFSGKYGAADFLLSHLNSYFRSSYSFCFHALAVCIISLGIDEGKSKQRCQAKELKKKKKIQTKFARRHGNTLPHLPWWAEGGFPCWVKTWSAGDRGPAAVTSESPGGCHPDGERVCGVGLCLHQGEQGTSPVRRKVQTELHLL